MKRHRLYIAVFTSVILHMVMFTSFTSWWHSRDAIVMSSATHGNPLNISISQSAVSTSISPSISPSISQAISQPTKPQEKKATKAKVDSAKVSAAKIAVVTADTQQVKITTIIDKPANDAENEQAAINHEQDFALINNHMIDYLSTEFKLRFKYPVLARKRGWQGEVLLWLEINSQGEISNIAIKRSSGYKVLDRNAVKTFELIAIISPELKTELETKLAGNHRLSIPVIYKLTGS